jgi:hypothetical protein
MKTDQNVQDIQESFTEASALVEISRQVFQEKLHQIKMQIMKSEDHQEVRKLLEDLNYHYQSYLRTLKMIEQSIPEV